MVRARILLNVDKSHCMSSSNWFICDSLRYCGSGFDFFGPDTLCAGSFATKFRERAHRVSFIHHALHPVSDDIRVNRLPRDFMIIQLFEIRLESPKVVPVAFHCQFRAVSLILQVVQKLFYHHPLRISFIVFGNEYTDFYLNYQIFGEILFLVSAQFLNIDGMFHLQSLQN